MTVEPGYPITMVHPQHKTAKVAKDNERATPEQFPNIIVNGAMSEAQYRSQGYLRFGEAQKVAIDHYEYPKMMRHPDHEDEIPSRMEAKYDGDTGRITGSFRVAAVPAVFPDVTVKNLDEEELWEEKGYKAAGNYNKSALDAALNGTVSEETYEPQEYPKWDGKKYIAKDPNQKEEPEVTPEYPRWENGVLITDPRFPQEPDPTKYPMWVHKDGIPSKDSVLVKNPSEEFIARKKFAPEEEKEIEDSMEELSLTLSKKAPKLSVFNKELPSIE